ncbi:hypothetical protein [Paraburkholderia kururiensis]|uniref:hypothetical protein n=1 Tax=Paraburkholderia kururiensis TaxID=984307 RepID=UPI0003497FA7|nr:hypothetical protein [Paraburkholderia kururiensis]
MAAKKRISSKRAEMIEVVRQFPGITSAEIAQRLGIDTAIRVSNALYTNIKAGRIVTERIERNGHYMNAHYMSDQIPPDAVERISQKLVDASEAIPAAKSPSARNSVFDVPKAARSRKPVSKRAATTLALTTDVPRTFSCAIANDGSLVLMRGGRIEMSLPQADAAALQQYLVKRAAANFLASMA